MEPPGYTTRRLLVATTRCRPMRIVPSSAPICASATPPAAGGVRGTPSRTRLSARRGRATAHSIAMSSLSNRRHFAHDVTRGRSAVEELDREVAGQHLHRRGLGENVGEALGRRGHRPRRAGPRPRRSTPSAAEMGFARDERLGRVSDLRRVGTPGLVGQRSRCRQPEKVGRVGEHVTRNIAAHAARGCRPARSRAPRALGRFHPMFRRARREVARVARGNDLGSASGSCSTATAGSIVGSGHGWESRRSRSSKSDDRGARPGQTEWR